MQPLQRDRGAPGQQLQRPEPQVWEGGGGGSAAQGEGEERPAAWAQRGGGGSAEPREGLLPPDRTHRRQRNHQEWAGKGAGKIKQTRRPSQRLTEERDVEGALTGPRSSGHKYRVVLLLFYEDFLKRSG